jgi:hypothetical protein
MPLADDPDVAGRYQRRRSRAGTAWSTAGTRQPHAGISRAAALNQVTIRPPRRRQPHRAASPATSPSPRPSSASPPARRSSGTPRATAVSDLNPDQSVPGPDRDRDRLSRITRAAVLHTITQQLPVNQQDGDIPARVHRAEHRVHERARPASVTLSRTAAPAISAPALPRPPDCGITGPPDGHTGDARPAHRGTSSRNMPPARPVRGRP